MDNPFKVFGEWYSTAEQSEVDYPNACALASVNEDSMPDVRIVLLKEWDATGFVFYTNTESTKGKDLIRNPQCALCFHWKSIKRQVRIRGSIDFVDEEQADRYFDSRPRGSRLGAWASDQSRPMASKLDLHRNIARFTVKFGTGNIPRPPHWTGIRISPVTIEFWSEGSFRLHERTRYSRSGVDDDWEKTLLFP